MKGRYVDAVREVRRAAAELAEACRARIDVQWLKDRNRVEYMSTPPRDLAQLFDKVTRIE